MIIVKVQESLSNVMNLLELGGYGKRFFNLGNGTIACYGGTKNHNIIDGIDIVYLDAEGLTNDFSLLDKNNIKSSFQKQMFSLSNELNAFGMY